MGWECAVILFGSLICFGNEFGGEMNIEIHHLVIAHRLAIPGKLQPAFDQPGILQFFQVHDQQWAADADFTRELADIIRLIQQRRDDLQAMGISQSGERLNQVRAR